ncbi:MAG: ABC transporter permease [Bacillota bacterium]|nr:ABC transporter permease [Bacillota bacterium]
MKTKTAAAKQPSDAGRSVALGSFFDSTPFRALICFVAPVTIFGLLLASEGKSVFETYKTIYFSIFGSVYGIGEVVIRATYLILTSIAAILPARVGLANAGGEGQMAMGAVGTAVVGSTIFSRLVTPVGIPMMLLAGMFFGALWAGIGIYCYMRLGMNETLTTILMNYISTFIIAMLLFGVLRDPKGWNYPQTVQIAKQLRFNMYFGTRMNVGIFIAIAMAFFVWFVINKTKAGFVIRTIGGNQNAARFAGINVKKVQALVFLAAGAVAGLAGAIMIVGVEGRMRTGAGETMGFMGFLAAGMVKNSPVLAILSAFLIGALNVAGNSMEIKTGLPAASIQILIMLVLLTIMTVGGKKKS